ncbi:ATP-dependent Clp protease adaptor protein ClpS [Planoprotostelium fungivorum]|uniref:ATP-dependent Clp protease adaptor protein ClpS n=1 Tax=Planoprotostelium fungivorum TaxID=1890364 RepID=A0A2P6N4J9_9EUKA|nr:ATP-dependent Clp protease adaptor protein ClpS [Planoprotostelium fungivorum]
MNTTNPTGNEFCLHCNHCEGFQPHYWNQSFCAQCNGPIQEHKWVKLDTKSGRPEIAELRDAPCRVVLFNDEIHKFNEVSDALIAATQCNPRMAEALAMAAHYDGVPVFEGSYRECTGVNQILQKENLDTTIEVDHLESEDNPDGHKLLYLLHRPTDTQVPSRTLFDLLYKALGFSNDRIKYTLRMAALLGRVSIHVGEFSECFMIKRMLMPFCTEIMEPSGERLRLVHRSIMKLCSFDSSRERLETALSGGVTMELEQEILRCAFRSNLLNLNIFSKALRSQQELTALDLSIAPDLRDNLPQVNDDWCVVISQYPFVTHLDLSGCEITVAGIKYLSQLPHLQHLKLSHLTLHDVGHPDLFEGFPALEILDLSESNHISGECLQGLGVKSNLRMIDLTDTAVQKSTISQLRRAYPHLVVQYTERKKETKSPLEEAIVIAFENVKRQLPNNPDISPRVMEDLFLRELYSITFRDATGTEEMRAAMLAMAGFDTGQEEEQEMEEEDENFEDEGTDSEDMDE